MVNCKVLFLVCGLIGVYGLEGDEVHIDPQPVITSTFPPQPTTTNGTTTTTITPPTTKSTTTASTTTSKTTTTVSPPTPAPSPDTTTTSTTTARPTKPTPAPTPVDPKVANWTVNYINSNRSCITVFVAAQFEVLGLPSANETLKINLPIDATGSGTCEGKTAQALKVSWGQNNSLELDFEKINSTKYDLSKIISILNVSLPTGPKLYKLVHVKPEFQAPLEKSYKCAKIQSLNLTEENSNVTVAYLHVSHLQYQAFRNTTEHKFDSALDCAPIESTDVVPIVVGCVLAVLVIAVLVAYLFGRRRCQARGYLSMFEETRSEADYIPMKRLSCFN